MPQGLSTPDPSLSPTHLSIRRGRTTTTHYTHHQVSLMVSRNTTLVPSLGLRSRNTTLVPSLGLRIGPVCEAGLSAGMRRQRVSPQIRKKEGNKERRKERKKETNKQTNKQRKIAVSDKAAAAAPPGE